MVGGTGSAAYATLASSNGETIAPAMV
jgi:hypothetical protein